MAVELILAQKQKTTSLLDMGGTTVDVLDSARIPERYRSFFGAHS